MSPWVRPERKEPSFFLYRALACLNAIDNILSARRADRDRFLTGGVEVWSRTAREAPSDSRSEVMSRISDMYSSGVSIMLRSKGPPHALSNSDWTKAAYTEESAFARTPYTRHEAERANALLLPSIFTKKSLVLMIPKYGS
jgi:hypothetical protein